MINAIGIRNAWREVFPKSSIGGFSNYFTGRLHASGEWTNGISANDPLWCRIILDEDFETVTIEGSILTKPKVVYHYASSTKWRKKTLKNPDYDRVVKAFKDIRSFILTNEANWHKDYAAIIKEKLS